MIAFNTYWPLYTDDPYYDHSQSLIALRIFTQTAGGTGGAAVAANAVTAQSGGWQQTYVAFNNTRAVGWAAQVSTNSCTSSVTTNPLGLNIRSDPVIPPPPNEDSNILWNIVGGILRIIGYHIAIDGRWLRVDLHTDGNGNETPVLGWVSESVYEGRNPCDNGTSITNLPILNPDGTPIATPTPTPSPTPTATATPATTPTPYPTVTPGTPPTPPVPLCTDQPAWIQNLCLQGWNYLSSEQQATLNPLIGADPNLRNFIPLDTWWLQNVGRGIGDVPPVIWQNDSLTQCAGSATCIGIVQDTSFLFENMWRIGVDWANAGEGQVRYDQFEGVQLKNQELWFLEGSDMSTIRQLDAYWGWLQDNGISIESWGFACDNFQFSTFSVPNGFNTQADVCWVCQDIPTLLYERRGFSLRNIMPSYLDLVTTDGDPADYNEAYYRNVPAVVDFADEYGGTLIMGSALPYRIGEMVFTSRLPLPSTNYNSFNHVAIVVRGVEQNISFEQALDYVLVAQTSFSSQGYFLSSFDPYALAISPDNAGARYEVITLRTYLMKHLLGGESPILSSEQVGGSNITAYADQYLIHWAPPEVYASQ